MRRRTSFDGCELLQSNDVLRHHQMPGGGRVKRKARSRTLREQRNTRRLRRPPEQMSSYMDNDHYNNVKKGTKKGGSWPPFGLLSGSEFLNFFVEAGGCKHILKGDVHAVPPVVVCHRRDVDALA